MHTAPTHMTPPAPPSRVPATATAQSAREPADSLALARARATAENACNLRRVTPPPCPLAPPDFALPPSVTPHPLPPPEACHNPAVA